MSLVWILLILGAFSYPKHVKTTNEYGGSSNGSVGGSRRFASASPNQNYGKQLIARSGDPVIDCDWINIGLANSLLSAVDKNEMKRIRHECRAKTAKEWTNIVNGNRMKPKRVRKKKTSTEAHAHGESSSNSRHPRGAIFGTNIPKWLIDMQKLYFPRGYEIFDCRWNASWDESRNEIPYLIYYREKLETIADRCPQKWSISDKQILLGGNRLTDSLRKKQIQIEKEIIWLNCDWIGIVDQRIFLKKPFRFTEYHKECERYTD